MVAVGWALLDAKKEEEEEEEGKKRVCVLWGRKVDDHLAAIAPF
jgi:hypothetical protein